MAAEFDLGFLGGGQLARMSIQAAQRMGLRCISLDPSSHSPAGQIAPSIVGRLDDAHSIAEIFARSRHATLENEFIPAGAIRDAFELAGVPEQILVPGVNTLATIQDKLRQREALALARVPTPEAVPIVGDGARAALALGFPLVLKARFGGYDGKGIRYIRTAEELEVQRPLFESGDWLAESFVPFTRELATMVWIEPGTGRAGAFPTVETVQENHVCSLVYPSGADASEIAIQAVRAVGGQGLFGVEMFELPDGSIQINELAPRPHNTGHYSLDWGGPSQFDVHVRLACRLRVGELMSGFETNDVCMANLLGQPDANGYAEALSETLWRHDRGRFHWYGKSEAKPGRKMGHLNVVRRPDESLSELIDEAKQMRSAFYQSWTSS